MKYLFVGLAALTMFASHASANFSGNYTVRYRIGPGHEKVNRLCVTFTQTGNVLGFPDSGDVTTPDNGGWSGHFIVDGNDLRFYATFAHGSVDAMHVRIKSGVPDKLGGFDEFFSQPPVPLSDGIFHIRAGCKGQFGTGH